VLRASRLIENAARALRGRPAGRNLARSPGERMVRSTSTRRRICLLLSSALPARIRKRGGDAVAEAARSECLRRHGPRGAVEQRIRGAPSLVVAHRSNLSRRVRNGSKKC
jgi:hypothetical protein